MLIQDPLKTGRYKMKIALAQMEVFPNQPKKNLETMLAMIEQAKKEKVDLIAFPEMCIGGYIVGDRWLEDSFCLNLMGFNEAMLRASRGVYIDDFTGPIFFFKWRGWKTH